MLVKMLWKCFSIVLFLQLSTSIIRETGCACTDDRKRDCHGMGNEHIPAIINGWYGGKIPGAAIVDVLFGDYNCSRKGSCFFDRFIPIIRPPFSRYLHSSSRTAVGFIHFHLALAGGKFIPLQHERPGRVPPKKSPHLRCDPGSIFCVSLACQPPRKYSASIKGPNEVLPKWSSTNRFFNK